MIHRPKKSLGQNFLKSKKTLGLMCWGGEVNKNDCVLEIGPGKGALTEVLLGLGVKLIAIEKDDDLFLFLREKFSEQIKSGQLVLKHLDILDFKTEEIKKEYKVIANIPYYITGLIIRKFLTTKNQPSKMVLLIQKEVAERIAKKNNKESVLSLSVGAYGDTKYISTVSKKLFSPKPKVDSAIILIDNISRKNFWNKKEEDYFFNLIKAGFAHKRKLLIRNLEKVVGEKKELVLIFEELGINQRVRSEDLSLEKWLSLSEKLLNN